MLRGEQVLFETARALELIGTLIAPVMPQTSAKLLAALGIELSFGVGKEYDHLAEIDDRRSCATTAKLYITTRSTALYDH